MQRPGLYAELRIRRMADGKHTSPVFPSPFMQETAAASPPAAPPRRWRRAMLWGALVALLLVAQSLLVMLTLSYETARLQEQADQVATEVVARAKQLSAAQLQGVQGLLWVDSLDLRWRLDALELMRQSRSLLRVELRNARRERRLAGDSPYMKPLFGPSERAQ